MFTAITYQQLNARQKELHNFHKIAARLADYGYHSMWLSDDWQGADFLACHIDGSTIIRVQLKSRLNLDKKYLGKDLHIAFRSGQQIFLYPHDALLDWVREKNVMDEDKAVWRDQGIRHWAYLPAWAEEFLIPRYELKALTP